MPTLTVSATDAAKPAAVQFALSIAQQHGWPEEEWEGAFDTLYADDSGNTYWLFSYDVSDDFVAGFDPATMPGLVLWLPPAEDAEPAPMPEATAGPIVAIVGPSGQQAVQALGLTWAG